MYNEKIVPTEFIQFRGTLFSKIVQCQFTPLCRDMGANVYLGLQTSKTETDTRKKSK